MKTRTAAGLEGLRMHDCRHFYAGRPLPMAPTHLWPTAEDRTRQAAEDMLLEALAGEESQNLADSVRTTGTK
jgi:hypothetical protein